MGSAERRFFQSPGGQPSGRFLAERRGSRQSGQRPGTGGDDLYLQAAQAELWEAVRGRKKVAKKNCTKVGLAEKSEAAAGEEIRERQIGIYQKMRKS